MFTPPGAALPITDGPFDLVAGLPAHPLVVHAAVVLLPLSALGLILVVLIPRARRPFAWITLVGLGVGAVAAWVAKESGEELAKRVGTPQDHANLGGTLPILAVVLLLIGIGWFVLQRLADGRRTVATVIAGVAAIIMSVAVIVMTIAVGHSGATAAWAGTVAATSAQPAAAAQPTPSATASADAGSGASATAAPTESTDSDPSDDQDGSDSNASDDGGSGNGGSGNGGSGNGAEGIFTLAEVADHADRSSCWAAINGNVYDLTTWIGQHPGGADRILSICGTDATAAFTTQHNGQQRPEAELATFQIGTLS